MAAFGRAFRLYQQRDEDDSASASAAAASAASAASASAAGSARRSSSAVYVVHRRSGRALRLGGCEAPATLSPAEVAQAGVSDTHRRHVDIYGCLGILPLPTGSGTETTETLVVVTACKSNGKLPGCEVFHISSVDIIPLGDDLPPVTQTHCSHVKQLFASGSFYFTVRDDENRGPAGYVYDITSRLQVHYINRLTATPITFEGQARAAPHAHLGQPDLRFWWSRFMWQNLEEHGVDCQEWLLPVIRGSAEIRTIYVGAMQVRAALISRLTCLRAGTRFNARGIDDEGNAANFVETEQIIFANNQIMAFTQTRGSVPIFWAQPGLNVGQHRVHLTREFEATQPAFERHCSKQIEEYGPQAFVSLLSKKLGESTLNSLFERHVDDSPFQIDFYSFDVHNALKTGSGDKLERLAPLIVKLGPCLNDQSFFVVDGTVCHRWQAGCLRVNCLDCLDRTNLCQTVVGLKVLDAMLTYLWKSTDLRDSKLEQFRRVFIDMWGKNGDNLSRCVTGTGALSGGAKATILKDMQRSVVRTIRNNFMDNRRQTAIDIVLGKYRDIGGSDTFRVPDEKLRQMLDETMNNRKAEYSRKVDYKVAVGTWNVAGGKHIRSVLNRKEPPSLEDWFIDPVRGQNMDIYAIGLEEVVDLNAQNIVSTASHTRKEWAAALKRVLPGYALLTSIQLVGICLFIFARSALVDDIRDVETNSVKTGAGGNMGNKGGVAVRLKLHNTKICFVCTHLAAGKSHAAERNQDAANIARQLDFGKGRSLESHDCIFWCGDLNYRIDLSNEECRALCAACDYDQLLAHDQLHEQRGRGNVFVGFREGRPRFAPTYKYDIFSDSYDTSEKERVPSWTDRVLFRGDGIRLRYYGRNETLKVSDHRAVLATFDVTVESIDPTAEVQVREEVMQALRRKMATVVVTGRDTELSLDDVQEAFRECGRIVMIDQQEGRSTTLVTFENTTSVDKALAMSGKPLLGDVGAVVDVSVLHEDQDADSVLDGSTDDFGSVDDLAAAAIEGIFGSHRSGSLSQIGGGENTPGVVSMGGDEDASSGYVTAPSAEPPTPASDVVSLQRESPPPPYTEGERRANIPPTRPQPPGASSLRRADNALSKSGGGPPPARPAPPYSAGVVAPVTAAVGAAGAGTAPTNTVTPPRSATRTASVSASARRQSNAAPPARPAPPTVSRPAAEGPKSPSGSTSSGGAPPPRPAPPSATTLGSSEAVVAPDSSTTPKKVPPARPQAPKTATANGATATAAAPPASPPTVAAAAEIPAADAALVAAPVAAPAEATTSINIEEEKAPIVPRRTKSRLDGSGSRRASMVLPPTEGAGASPAGSVATVTPAAAPEISDGAPTASDDAGANGEQ